MIKPPRGGTNTPNKDTKAINDSYIPVTAKIEEIIKPPITNGTLFGLLKNSAPATPKEYAAVVFVVQILKIKISIAMRMIPNLNRTSTISSSCKTNPPKDPEIAITTLPIMNAQNPSINADLGVLAKRAQFGV